MKKLGERYAKSISGGQVVDLKGEMGAGKTAFTKGIALGLGITEAVTSPTFAIMNEYRGEKLRLCHFDFYRVVEQTEAEELGLTEFFGGEGTACVLEWAENISEYLPEDRRIVEIRKTGGNRREVIFYDERTHC